MGSLYRRKPGGVWYAKFSDAHGKIERRSTKTTSKDVARQILRAWQDNATLARAGVIAPAAKAEPGQSRKAQSEVAAAIDEYLEYLQGNGNKHLTLTESRLRRLADHCGWQAFNQIDAYATVEAVKQMVDVAKKAKPRLSKTTQGHYIGTAKAFTKWLVNSGKTLRDPLALAKKPRVTDADRKRSRRYLLPEEWVWLQQTPQAVLYETAIQTGFRLTELVAIQRTHLKDGRIVLPAKHTKNKQIARQPVTASLFAKLPAALPFHVPFDGSEYRGAEQLRENLAAARAAYENATPAADRDAWLLMPTNADGDVLDFHALRHTCGAWLALKDVYPKTIQQVMRHSSIQLTFDTYGHMFPGAAEDAIGHFSSYFG